MAGSTVWKIGIGRMDRSLYSGQYCELRCILAWVGGRALTGSTVPVVSLMQSQYKKGEIAI